MKSIPSKNIKPANSSHSPFFQKESNNFFEKSNKPFFNTSSIQAKLTDNQPNNPHEKEADEMADTVVQTSAEKFVQLHKPGIAIQLAPSTALPKPRKPTIDEIAKEIGPGLGGPYSDYNAFAATMVAGNFLGHPIARGVRPEFLTKLNSAKIKIDAEFGKSGNTIPSGYGINSVGGFRSKAGPHGWGLALDIDVAGNPFVMHEHNEAILDAQLTPVYHRIAETMINSPIGNQQSIIPKIITQGGSMTGTKGQSRADRLGEYYDRLVLESQAMKDYFRLMHDPDPDAIKKFLAGPWVLKHPLLTAPAPNDMLRQMWDDYATLGGQVPKGGPLGVPGFQAPGAVGKADRPFSPSSGGQQDPAAGFITIPREVVLGLGQTVSRWGAIDFGGESGDIQHFDDMGGLGGTISKAIADAKAKIAASIAAPTVTSETFSNENSGTEEGGASGHNNAAVETGEAV